MLGPCLGGCSTSNWGLGFSVQDLDVVSGFCLVRNLEGPE